MSLLSATLGLRATEGLTPNCAPVYLCFHFVWAYIALAPRHLKQRWGIDHQSAPRDDVSKYGEAAVASNKITRQQLNMIKRTEAAHANSIENYTLLVGSMVLATTAGVDPHTINRAGIIYTLARIGYGIYYIAVEDDIVAIARALFWWAGNGSCLWLLWEAGKLMVNVN
ncbi:hypothetical protein GGR50DRAFT_218667 [Xylaria sp. CBS 124048]|nr:hypothetical protein GGR50DRAFT_218667 [Xylaria sp. CBS 124048]